MLAARRADLLGAIGIRLERHVPISLSETGNPGRTWRPRSSAEGIPGGDVVTGFDPNGSTPCSRSSINQARAAKALIENS